MTVYYGPGGARQQVPLDRSLECPVPTGTRKSLSRPGRHSWSAQWTGNGLVNTNCQIHSRRPLPASHSSAREASSSEYPTNGNRPATQLLSHREPSASVAPCVYNTPTNLLSTPVDCVLENYDFKFPTLFVVFAPSYAPHIHLHLRGSIKCEIM